VTGPVPVGVIELDGLALGLRAGRRVVVTGEPVDDPGNVRVHATTLSTVVHDFGERVTRITLARFLPGPLVRSSVVIQANVAPGSHGQTRREPLGSGDATVPFQRFALRQPPLTYLSASGATGLASTLAVWVDGVRWREVPSLFDAGPQDRVYVVRDTDGVTTVQFGDGVTGARLPTGTANVRAIYRSGGGLAGRVGAGQLTMPLSRAGGVSEVTNPAPASGGDDPEAVDGARSNVPLRVKTLDRVVSLVDYADFARAFPGVAKASAVWARVAGHRGVLLSVAGAGGATIAGAATTSGRTGGSGGTGGSGDVGANLRTALRTFGDPLVPVELVPCVRRVFRISALVKVAADRERDAVLAEAGAALRARFSFAARDLGQPVPASEVLAVLYGVPGIVAATLAALWKFIPGEVTSAPTGPAPALLTAAQPAPGTDLTGKLVGAELLTLDDAAVTWGVLP
jgi:predicted phage baseplate assembly protein